MHRVSLGKNKRFDGHELFNIDFIERVDAILEHRINIRINSSVYTDDDGNIKFSESDILQLPTMSNGEAPTVKILQVSWVGDIFHIWTEHVIKNGQLITSDAELQNEFLGRQLINTTYSERQMKDEYGLRVSRPGANVLDPVNATTGNLAFDSSDYVMGSLKVIQTGTFQIQCKKTYFGKKGNLEILSDEQARANEDYIKKYPMELEHMNTSEYSQDPVVSSGVYGFDTGQVAHTGNGYNSQYVQNVYCDYGTQTIEFNPPLPDHIKTPFISVHFALANSSGHFHPWYANVNCTTGEEDYQWQYANSQHCVHMDSAWFRGKWAFRDRAFNPYGDLLNLDYKSSWNNTEDQTDAANSIRSRNWSPPSMAAPVPEDFEGEDFYSASMRYGEHVHQYTNEPRKFGDDENGWYYDKYIMKMRGSGDWIGRHAQNASKYTPNNTKAMGGMAVKKYTPPLIQDLHRFEQDVLPQREAFDFDPSNSSYKNTKYHKIRPDQSGSESPQNFEEVDVVPNAPAALWGGIFKSFAGLQGLTYYANTTHLTLDGFLTPTHSPTPFETELVKTRVENPHAAHGDLDKFNWHNGKYLGDWNESFDMFGQIRKNVGWDDDMIWGNRWGGSGDYFPHAHKDPILGATQYQPWDFDDVAYVANNHGYGLDYVEKLPRTFRTKYWDGSKTEYQWWPIGHANGHFTIVTGIKKSITGVGNTSFAGGVGTNQRDRIIKEMIRKDADARGFSDKDVKILGAAEDNEYVTHIGATYGDYSPISTFGKDYQSRARGVGGLKGERVDEFSVDYKDVDYDEGEHSPFNAFINKGTRFSNQLPNTEGKGYPPNSQYEPGDAFLKTRTFQGQPTSLDSFWNSFSNNMSQWVAANTPYGEFYYADGGYAMDLASYYNYGGGKFPYGAVSSKGTVTKSYISGSSIVSEDHYLVKFMPSDFNIQRQSFSKHNWNGGNPKAGVGTEGRRFGFGGAGSAEALGGEGEGVFDTYIGKYVVYDIEGGDFGG